jgi:hypothetical protein
MIYVRRERTMKDTIRDELGAPKIVDYAETIVRLA